MKLMASKRLLLQKRVNRFITTTSSVLIRARWDWIFRYELCVRRCKRHYALRVYRPDSGNDSPFHLKKFSRTKSVTAQAVRGDAINSTVEYKTEDYPRAVDFIDSHCYIFDVNPPNDIELMSYYVEAFHKVMDQFDAALEVPETA